MAAPVELGRQDAVTPQSCGSDDPIGDLSAVGVPGRDDRPTRASVTDFCASAHVNASYRDELNSTRPLSCLSDSGLDLARRSGAVGREQQDGSITICPNAAAVTAAANFLYVLTIGQIPDRPAP
jgi:hypothetical protein